MAKLMHIDEERMRALVCEESERAREMRRDHIKNPDGFVNHLIAVGNTAHEVAGLILDRNPSFIDKIDPDVARTTGYFHDFAKIGGNVNNPDQEGGDAWHDLEGPFMVFDRNEELGLVRGGTPEQIKTALRQIALGISSDYALAEEMGQNFPKTAAYRIAKGLDVRLNTLREWLSEDGKPITVNQLWHPDTLMRQVAQYADMVKVGGGLKELGERRAEIEARYTRWADEQDARGNNEKPHYFRHQAMVSHQSPRLKAQLRNTVQTVEQLAGLTKE